MSLYSNIDDVRIEFKSLPNTGDNVITSSKILEYLLQANSFINSKLGTRYVTPVTGQAPVDQVSEITIDTIVDTKDYSLIISRTGYEKIYTFTSGVAATAQEITDGLVALINNDVDRIINVLSQNSPKFKITSKVMGLDFTVSQSSDMSSVLQTQAELGSNDLRLLRTIEAGMAACKIAEILKVKVSNALAKSGVRQDIKDGSCLAKYLKILDDIQNNQLDLEDAVLKSQGSGLASYGQRFGIEKVFKRGVDQW